MKYIYTNTIKKWKSWNPSIVKNLAIVKKFGDKTEFTIARFHCIIFSFQSLESLTLENYTWHTKDEKYYEDCFSNLTKLVLKNPKMVGIDVEFLDKLGNWCRNLDSITLTLYYRDSFTRVYKFKSKNFFPKLESLTIDGDVSLSLIETLLTSAGQGRLKSLTIYIHQLGIVIWVFILHTVTYKYHSSAIKI